MNIPPFQRLLIATICLIVAAHARANTLLNYEQDEDLGNAMHFDTEVNGTNRDIGSQAQAEMNYLRYLEHAGSASQRARVYVQLGNLFSTNWLSEKKEKPDYNKARQYFQKAIDAAPESVGLPLVRARLGLVTPLQTPDERLRIRLDAFDWLQRIDKAKLQSQWLESRPGEVPSLAEVEAVASVISNVRLAERDNILGAARGSSDPLQALRDISARFPRADLGITADKIRSRLEAVNEQAVEPQSVRNPVPESHATMHDTVAARAKPMSHFWKICFSFFAITGLAIIIIGAKIRVILKKK